MRLLLFLCLLAWLPPWTAPSMDDSEDPAWELVPPQTNASLRGLFVWDSDVVWASGTNGTVVHSADQGQTWHVQKIPGAETLDIRDLHVFDAQNILAMTSGTPARLYRTANAGADWKLVYESNDPQVFLDSVTFLNENRGLVMGDPIDRRLFLLHSNDSGWTWAQVPNTPELKLGEAGFAASGTNMTTLGTDRWAIALGGDLPADKPDGPDSKIESDHHPSHREPRYSRIVTVDSKLQEWRISTTPLRRHESGGVFSLVFLDSKRGIAVGGDYQQPELAQDHLAVTSDGGETWTVPDSAHQPSGFRSGVAVGKSDAGARQLIAVGTNGTDLSLDLGQTWQRVSETGFNAVQFSPDGRTGWAAGSNGRIAKWKLKR